VAVYGHLLQLELASSAAHAVRSAHELTGTSRIRHEINVQAAPAQG